MNRSPVYTPALGARSRTPNGSRGGVIALIVLCLAAAIATSFAPGLALAGAVAVCYAAFCTKYRRAAFLVLVGVAPVIVSLRRGLFVPGFRPSEILIAGSCVILWSWKRDQFRRSSLDKMLLIYAAATLALACFNLSLHSDPVTSDVLGKMIGPIQFYLLFRLATAFGRDSGLRRSAVRTIVWVSLPVSLVAIVQQLNLLGVRDVIVSLTDSLSLQGWGYTQLARATGPFAHWHTLGGYLVVTLLLISALLLSAPEAFGNRRALFFIGACNALALVATLTMVDIFAGLAGVLLVAYKAGKLGRALRMLPVAAVLVAIVFGPFIIQRLDRQYETRSIGYGQIRSSDSLLPQTVQFRIEVWKHDYLPVISKNFLTGYGLTAPENAVWKHTESFYITILLRGGLPLATIVLLLLRAAWRRTGEADELVAKGEIDWAIVTAVKVLLVLLLGMHLVHPYLTDAGLPHLFWLLCGLVNGLCGARSDEQFLPASAQVAQ